MTIMKVLPVSERQYKDLNGIPRTFVSRGLLLSDGNDKIYAEITGETARRNDLEEGISCSVIMTCNARQYEDKNHDIRYSNEVVILRLGLRIFLC